jgi:hypothetical protein
MSLRPSDVVLLREALELHEVVVVKSELDIRKADLLLQAILCEVQRQIPDGAA